MPTLPGMTCSRGSSGVSTALVLIALLHASEAAGRPPARVTAIAAHGSEVWIGTDGDGLKFSSDGGVSFSPVSAVACPQGIVLDVALTKGEGSPERVLVTCGDLRTAFLREDGFWRRPIARFSSGPRHGCPDTAGEGRSQIHDDPLVTDSPIRLAAAICGECPSSNFVTTFDEQTVVRELAGGGCLLVQKRLLAPVAAVSPFLVFSTQDAAAARIRRGLARERFRAGSSDPVFYLSIEPLTTIPDAGLSYLTRDGIRSEHLLATGREGVWVSADEGRTFSLLPNPGGPVRTAAVDGSEEGRWAVAKDREILVTTDGGATWTVVSIASVLPTSLAYDTADPERLFVGRENGTVDILRLAGGGNPTLLPPVVDASSGSVLLSFLNRSIAPVSQRVERSVGVPGSWLRLALLPREARSFVDASAPRDIALFYRIVTTDEAGVETVSRAHRAVSPTTEPLPPEEVVSTTLEDGTIRISWRDVSGREDGTLIEFQTLGGTIMPLVFVPADTTSYDLKTALAVSHARLRTQNVMGVSPPSAWVRLGGSPPKAAPTLTGLLEGSTPSLAMTAAKDTFTFAIERSVDDAPFERIALVPAEGSGPFRSASFRDRAFETDHNLVYRAVPLNPSGEGPVSAAVSLGIWSTEPLAPDGLAATIGPGIPHNDVPRTLRVTWTDRSGREDGFRITARPRFGTLTSPLGVTPRNQTAFEIDYRLPANATFPDTRFEGDLMVGVEAFNGRGSGGAETPLRVWPYAEDQETDDLWRSRGIAPFLLPSILTGPGRAGAPVATELFEPNADRGGLDQSRAYRLLDERSGSLLTGLLPVPPGRGLVLPALGKVVFGDHPLFPTKSGLSGALLRWGGAAPLAYTRLLSTVSRDGRSGQAGASFSAVRADRLDGRARVIAGFREDSRWRSDLVLVHPGISPVSVRVGVTVVVNGAARELAPVTLERGARVVLESVLGGGTGAVVVRSLGEETDPFFAHGLAWDTRSHDARVLSATQTATGYDITRVESGPTHRSTLAIVNARTEDTTLQLTAVSAAPENRTFAVLAVTIPGLRQIEVDIVRLLRDRGDLPGERFLGSVRVRGEGSLEGIGIAAGLETMDGDFGEGLSVVPAGASTERRDSVSNDLRVSALQTRRLTGTRICVVNTSDRPVSFALHPRTCPVSLTYNCVRGAALGAATLPPGGLWTSTDPLVAAGIAEGWVESLRLPGGSLYAYALELDPVTGDPSLRIGTGGLEPLPIEP